MKSRYHDSHGFSLIEVTMTMGMLGIGALAASQILLASVNANQLGLIKSEINNLDSQLAQAFGVQGVCQCQTQENDSEFDASQVGSIEGGVPIPFNSIKNKCGLGGRDIVTDTDVLAEGKLSIDNINLKITKQIDNNLYLAQFVIDISDTRPNAIPLRSLVYSHFVGTDPNSLVSQKQVDYCDSESPPDQASYSGVNYDSIELNFKGINDTTDGESVDAVASLGLKKFVCPNDFVIKGMKFTRVGSHPQYYKGLTPICKHYSDQGDLFYGDYFGDLTASSADNEEEFICDPGLFYYGDRSRSDPNAPEDWFLTQMRCRDTTTSVSSQVKYLYDNWHPSMTTWPLEFVRCPMGKLAIGIQLKTGRPEGVDREVPEILLYGYQMICAEVIL